MGAGNKHEQTNERKKNNRQKLYIYYFILSSVSCSAHIVNCLFTIRFFDVDNQNEIRGECMSNRQLTHIYVVSQNATSASRTFFLFSTPLMKYK